MAVMDSLADHYAIEDRQEQDKKAEDALQKARQDEISRKGREAAEKRATEQAELEEKAKTNPCLAQELEAIRKLNIKENDPVPKCGVIPTPKFPRNAYPATVVVRIDVDAGGNVADVSIARSSRNKDIDKLVLETAKKFQFVPGTPGKILVPYSFDYEK